MTYRIEDLPVPPSANNLFRTGKGADGKPRRFRTKRYAAWADAVEPLVRASGRSVPGTVGIRIDIAGGKGFPVNRDLDNCSKAVQDALVSCGKIDGDDVRTVRRLVLEYTPATSIKDRARVDVTVERWGVGPTGEGAAHV